MATRHHCHIRREHWLEQLQHHPGRDSSSRKPKTRRRTDLWETSSNERENNPSGASLRVFPFDARRPSSGIKAAPSSQRIRLSVSPYSWRRIAICGRAKAGRFDASDILTPFAGCGFATEACVNAVAAAIAGHVSSHVKRPFGLYLSRGRARPPFHTSGWQKTGESRVVVFAHGPKYRRCWLSRCFLAGSVAAATRNYRHREARLCMRPAK